ncbi:MAG: hypothetical protein RIR00_1627, partial [Pseudomonadota bacterium]
MSPTRPSGRYPYGLIFAMGVLIALVVVLFRLSGGVNENHRHGVDLAMRELAALDTTLNLDILRLRQQQMLNYDSLSQSSRRIEDLLQHLDDDFAEVDASAAMKPLRETWQGKLEMIERFKQLNAVLINSEYHFTNLAGSLDQRLHQGPAQSQVLDEVTRDMLIFITRSDSEETFKLQLELNRLRQSMQSWPLAERQSGEL